MPDREKIAQLVVEGGATYLPSLQGGRVLGVQTKPDGSFLFLVQDRYGKSTWRPLADCELVADFDTWGESVVRTNENAYCWAPLRENSDA